MSRLCRVFCGVWIGSLLYRDGLVRDLEGAIPMIFFQTLLPHYEHLSLWTQFRIFQKVIFNIELLDKILKLYFIISHELVCDFTFKSWFFKSKIGDFGMNFDYVFWDFEG